MIGRLDRIGFGSHSTCELGTFAIDPKRPVARDPCSHSLVDGLRLVAKRTSARGLPSMVMHMMRIGHVRMHMPQRLVLMPMAVFAYGHRLVIMVVMTVVVSMGVLML